MISRSSSALIAAGYLALPLLVAINQLWLVAAGRDASGRLLYATVATSAACLVCGAAMLPITGWKRGMAAVFLVALLAAELGLLAILSLVWGGLEGTQ